SDELLDDILPRIRRQLSLQTDHARLLEEAPTRGAIDWTRTIERTLRETPGLPPLCFDTHLRQRSSVTPENLLTVAILLAFRQALHRVRQEGFSDDPLDLSEQSFLSSVHEPSERELAAPYARDLLAAAAGSDIDTLGEQVLLRLHPGGNPYRDLLDWWQRFQ